ncbi:MAG TPA: DUF3052 domain-containing protein [Solirubrobacteraceae bacterium]|nr:DUF3052 domain-containing protein [Solirubrobacteraceae bacterium]
MSSGYSGTPLAKKLGCKPGGRLLTRGAPTGFTVPGLPEGCRQARLRTGMTAGAREDVLLAFYAALSELETTIAALGDAVFPDGALWIAWPRRAAGHDSDIREQDIRDLALPLGLVDVKVAAIDEDWSGLRLVWRRERRSAPAAQRG